MPNCITHLAAGALRAIKVACSLQNFYNYSSSLGARSHDFSQERYYALAGLLWGEPSSDEYILFPGGLSKIKGIKLIFHIFILFSPTSSIAISKFVYLRSRLQSYAYVASNESPKCHDETRFVGAPPRTLIGIGLVRLETSHDWKKIMSTRDHGKGYSFLWKSQHNTGSNAVLSTAQPIRLTARQW